MYTETLINTITVIAGEEKNKFMHVQRENRTTASLKRITRTLHRRSATEETDSSLTRKESLS